ncbi:MAG: T9SS type A sorting domain-containing protein [Desulfobulbaceae bacterium]|nr:T9SS type A sorting domain-containing protein [Desulfobulbaceae bacterium]
MKQIIFALFLLLAANTQAQQIGKEYYNWHFGNFGAVSFNNPNLEPVSYVSSMSTLEGSASISDKDANLLFYTNGEYVWNRQNNLMPNGTNLKGHESSTQSAIIIKKPGSDNLYYIFTVGKGPYTPVTPQDFCYSIVDLNQDNGNGDVIIKNIKIHNVDVVEKLTAVMHANDKDYWIIAHEINSANFVVALLTENGIENVTTQNIGPIYDLNTEDKAAVTLGHLKSNIRGDRLAAVCFSLFDMDLYHFNRELGIISDHLPIEIDNIQGTYGVEFSPSGRFVYTSNVHRRILQFDISNYNKNSIEQSRQTIYSNYASFQSFGSLQLAPNGKIYIAIYGARNLSAINQPDSAGVACDLQFNATGLVLGFSEFGLPNYCVTEQFKKLVVKGGDVCEGQDIELIAEVIPGGSFYTYEWTGPNGFSANSSKIIIKNAQSVHEGNYIVKAYELGELIMTESIYISVHPNPIVKIIGPKSICPPDIAKLRVEFIEDGTSYLWSNGITNHQIEVYEPGNYYVIAKSIHGCIDTAYFNIELSNNLDAKIVGPTGFCQGDTITLTANKFKELDLIDYYYLWSTGDTTRSIIVTEPGEYSLIIKRFGGCLGYDTIQVMGYPHPDVQLSHSGIVTICNGQSVKISVTNPSLENIYTWDDGIIGTSRIVSEPGVYKIYSMNQYKCIDSVEVLVQIGEKPDVEVEFSNDLIFCKGDSVTATVNFDYQNNDIIWEDGSTDVFRKFYESGKYKCVVYDENGCSDTTEFEIKVFDIEKPEIIADKIYVCEAGTPVTLSANQEYHEYLWSNGAISQSIIIDKAGIYKLIVRNEIGCEDSAEIEIFIMPIEKPEITASNYFICDNDTLTLTANGDYASYLWSDGSTSSSAVVSNSGTYKVIVTNEIGCIDSAEVTISDLIVDIRFDQSSYSEKTVCTGTKSLIKAVLVNHTEAESTIDEIILNNVQNFKLISPGLPFTIGAFESKEIILEAISDETGFFETSILAISNQPCYHETMSSASQKFSLTNQIRLPEIEAIAGEQLCIPIYGKINCGASPFVSSATIQISFDADYFNPINLKSGTNFTKVIENGICTVTIDYTSLNLTETETMIDELCGVALVGRDIPTELAYGAADWHDDLISTEKINGSLKIEACVIDLRPINFIKPAALQIAPNPASETVELTITTEQMGLHKVDIFDLNGMEIASFEFVISENSQQVNIFSLYSREFKNGFYIIRVKSPDTVIFDKLIIEN